MNRVEHGDYKYQQYLIDFLNHKQLIFFVKIFHGRYGLPFNITIPKRDHIEKLII